PPGRCAGSRLAPRKRGMKARRPPGVSLGTSSSVKRCLKPRQSLIDRSQARSRSEGLDLLPEVTGNGMAVCAGERRLLVPAALAGVRAAGMEAATLRRAVRARHVALQHQALALERGIGNWDGGEQRARVRMPGFGDQ